ncbi:hypothetical protein NFI96_029397, partial [Prochilodus magdalenae]
QPDPLHLPPDIKRRELRGSGGNPSSVETGTPTSSSLLGHVPQTFKTASVVPILKKPSLDTSDISSCGPDINQFIFKPAPSTETALVAVTERHQATRSAKLSSVLILLDLSAAFDTVNHKILLSVLTNLGITGTTWKWFESYLEDRHYQVTWKGSMSAPWRLSMGSFSFPSSDTQSRQ